MTLVRRRGRVVCTGARFHGAKTAAWLLALVCGAARAFLRARIAAYTSNPRCVRDCPANDNVKKMGLGSNKTLPRLPQRHLAMARPGYVYAFSTPSMPGIVKIGATDRDPSLRLAEANAGTWSPPEPYVVACAVAGCSRRPWLGRLSARGRLAARGSLCGGGGLCGQSARGLF